MELSCTDSGLLTGRSGGTGTHGREVSGTILNRRQCGRIAISIVDSGRPECASWTILPVRNGRKRCKV